MMRCSCSCNCQSLLSCLLSLFTCPPLPQFLTPHREPGLKLQVAICPSGLSFLWSEVLMIYYLGFRSVSSSLSPQTVSPLLARFFCVAVSHAGHFISVILVVLLQPSGLLDLSACTKGPRSGQVAAADYG